MNRFLIVLLIFFTACNSKPEVPKHVLQPEKMEAVMYDLIQVDGMAGNGATLDSLSRGNEPRFKRYRQVMSLHRITKEQFVRSMKFYEGNPPLLKRVLDSLSERASRPLPQNNKDTTKNKPVAV